ncbi:solute carrier family 15 member 2 [Culicoides brevitarsis]|uniref:solute carrier family 15 member 2 n=1 Tax=Culicoides brevitarsis TaxID=469753 RepID=UPI00307B9D78
MHNFYIKNTKTDFETLPILGNEKHQKNCDYGSTKTEKPTKDDSDCFKYPIAVIFVLASKFFEAFAANGVRTVLALFLHDSIQLSEDASSVVLHLFNFFSQFCPIFGAVLADSYLGNAKTLFIFYIPYAIGYVGLVLTTVPYLEEIISTTTLVYVSLLLISIGNGNLRACITSLGGHQFILPEQKPELDQYFSHYYFVYTLGILLSKVFPPEVRSVTTCFQEDVCYTAVFGLLCIVFFASWFIFLLGLCFYKSETPQHNNVLCQVIACVWHALWNKVKGKSSSNEWLDSAVGKYSDVFVNDVRSFLRVTVLFIPLPIYWSLLAQQDSSWTFQATQMNTTIAGYYIQPDQIKAIGPLLLLLLIPLFEKVINPFCHQCQISPLHSVSLGGFSAAFSFACAGILQILIEKSDYTLSVIWQFPQFLFLQLGEVLLSIPGLQFAFTQAPSSMKSVLTAAWFCNNAFGNLIVVIMKEVKPVHDQSTEFFMYSILMLLGIVIFSFLAHWYEQRWETRSSEGIIASEEQTIEKFVYVEELGLGNLEGNSLESLNSNCSKC